MRELGFLGNHCSGISLVQILFFGCKASKVRRAFHGKPDAPNRKPTLHLLALPGQLRAESSGLSFLQLVSKSNIKSSEESLMDSGLSKSQYSGVGCGV